MRRKGYSEELIAESTGFGDTDNEDIISAREEFQALEKKYKNEISGEAEQVRQAAVFASSAQSATSPAESTTSCADVPAVRATPA